jgi:hypothetical protein
MEFILDTNQDFFVWLAAFAGCTALILWIAWFLDMGFVRGTLAAVCRVGWIAPVFFCFFPRTTTEQLPRTMTQKPLHILLDDSESLLVNRDMVSGERRTVFADTVEHIEKECTRIGCIPKISLLSELDQEVRQGYSPLSRVLDSWIYKVGADHWMLATDGADFIPGEKWHPGLRGVGRTGPGTEQSRGLILGYNAAKSINYWIGSHDVPPFSFEDRPLSLSLTVRRRGEFSGGERVQVQVLTGETPLATVNAEFIEKDTESTVSVVIPPLQRGQHLLSLKVLPVASEVSLWDNVAYAQVEVMPNTVGVLHLLGSPSWDGRFLRRYLKSEPKYDLISFFILRDPWDSQQVSERELSLIPFPVERLFKEELPNFRVVVLQNFTLFQFLQPEYQQNLVQFVLDGGGLLFIGGPRSLQSADLNSSPLKAIIPFDMSGGGGPDTTPLDLMQLGGEFGSPLKSDPNGPAYDPDLSFKIELAEPTTEKRALANVYDEWEGLAPEFAAFDNARGLHHMERVRFREDLTTQLLHAKLQNGQKVPLAVASYPGKGRAIWLFSDSLWRMAMTVSDKTSRQIYNRFMQSAMTWLMKQDLRKPLVAKNLVLVGRRNEAREWRVSLQGPAARFFQPGKYWRISICGASVNPEKIFVSAAGPNELDLSGPLVTAMASGQRCTFELSGTHPAFGSLHTTVTSVFPEIYKDTEMEAAPQKLEDLAQLTGAALAPAGTDQTEAVDRWLAAATGQGGMALPSRYKTLRDFYWFLDTPWIWLLLLLMPLEVIIRKWNQLFAGSIRRDEVEPLTGPL